ncbi:MAG: DNA-processing protein DprA [Candidatus Woesearchaeota archaeon]|nr:DNA-processing protein DprA [Candidatus Woesearchaeota archaeon]
MLTPDQEESLYHVLLIEDISTASGKADDRLRKLLEQHGTLKNAYKPGLFKPETKRLEKRLERTDFKTITINSPEYPDWLKKLHATPVFYAQGDLELLKTKTIAVIGTRHPTQEALSKRTPAHHAIPNRNNNIPITLRIQKPTDREPFKRRNSSSTGR